MKKRKTKLRPSSIKRAKSNPKLKELKLAEDQVTRFRAILEAAPDAMVIVDKEGKIILVNAQTLTLFGYQREELIGQRIEVSHSQTVSGRASGSS